MSDCCFGSGTGWLKVPLIHQDRKCQRMRRSGSAHDECGYGCMEFEVPVAQVSRDALLAIGFPARSSEEGCGPGGGPFVGPLVPEFYTDVRSVHV